MGLWLSRWFLWWLFLLFLVWQLWFSCPSSKLCDELHLPHLWTAGTRTGLTPSENGMGITMSIQNTMYVHTHTRIHTRAHAHTRIHTRAHAHTHTHTHTSAPCLPAHMVHMWDSPSWRTAEEWTCASAAVSPSITSSLYEPSSPIRKSPWQQKRSNERWRDVLASSF